MSNRPYLFLLTALLWGQPGCKREGAGDLRVLTYDSLKAPGGLGDILFPEFEKSCGCKVHVTTAGDAGQIVARYALDKARGAPLPHILLGIDQNLFGTLKDETTSLIRLPQDLHPSTTIDQRFVPFDFGFFAFMARQPSLVQLKLSAPESYSDLLKDSWKSRFILQDPRTSSPGLGFLEAVEKVFGIQSDEFLRGLRGRWLTMPSGWDEAYGLFLKGEAPLVWSYTTSQAYHEHAGEKPGDYKAILFKEGAIIQIEGATAVTASLKSDRDRDLSKIFLETLLSQTVQSEIPKRQWMYPARTTIKLPAEFERVPKPSKILSTSSFDINAALKKWSEASLR